MGRFDVNTCDLQDTATNEEERKTAVEILKAAKEEQMNDPIAGGKGTKGVNGS